MNEQNVTQRQMDDPSTPEREWVATGLDRFGKLLLADRGRLMLDNQHTLDTSNAADRDNRNYAKRMREAQLEKMFPGASKIGEDINFPSEDDMASISIDSPINNYYYGNGGQAAQPQQQPIQPQQPFQQQQPPMAVAPPERQSGLSDFAKSMITGAAIAATGAAGAGGTYLAMRPTTPIAPTTIVSPSTQDSREYSLRLLKADKVDGSGTTGQQNPPSP